MGTVRLTREVQSNEAGKYARLAFQLCGFSSGRMEKPQGRRAGPALPSRCVRAAEFPTKTKGPPGVQVPLRPLIFPTFAFAAFVSFYLSLLAPWREAVLFLLLAREVTRDTASRAAQRWCRRNRRSWKARIPPRPCARGWARSRGRNRGRGNRDSWWGAESGRAGQAR
jgi:hypothetical protein